MAETMTVNSAAAEAKKPEKGIEEVVIEVGMGLLCRICHLNRDAVGGQTKGSGSGELIRVGCACRGELGFVHRDCGEAWFSVKGNRYCEICGTNAKNMTGRSDSRFMEEWHEGRAPDDINNVHLHERVSCWRSRAFCNFLLVCVIVAFVLPWFFRVKLF